MGAYLEQGKMQEGYEPPSASLTPPKPQYRTLVEIVTEIKKHREEFPRHGHNCSCMDKFSWELKKQLREVLPDLHSIDPPTSDLTLDTVWSLAYVLGMVTRYL